MFDDISFFIGSDDRIGLVGRNGAGKSTLLKIMAGQQSYDKGTIGKPKELTLGYLPQEMAHNLTLTPWQVAEKAFEEAITLNASLERIEKDLMTATTDEEAIELATLLAHAHERLNAIGAADHDMQIERMLKGIGFVEKDMHRLMSELSGGWRMRAELARLLLLQPDLLLLDEPTNHLDVAALEWLEGFVTGYPRAALIVSHDRAFLDRTVQRVLALDPELHTLRSYPGGYSAFAAARAQEREQQLATWKDQQAYVAQVRTDIARLKGQALNVENGSTPPDSPDDKYFLSQKGGSKKVAAKAKSRERKLERYLAADERVERPAQRWGMKLEFGEPPPGGRAVLSVEELRFAYPGGPELLGGLTLELWHGERVAIVGPNGAGKSTLLRLVAGELQPGGGRVRLGANVRVGLLAQEHEQLDLERSVLDHVLRARPMSQTEARNFLHFFLFGGDSVFRLAGQCSLGERSRLQLAVLVLQGCNLLLLDEPLNHLDIEAREHFEQALAAFEGAVIVVSHDRTFVASFAERVVELE